MNNVRKYAYGQGREDLAFKILNFLNSELPEGQARAIGWLDERRQILRRLADFAADIGADWPGDDLHLADIWDKYISPALPDGLDFEPVAYQSAPGKERRTVPNSTKIDKGPEKGDEKRCSVCQAPFGSGTYIDYLGFDCCGRTFCRIEIEKHLQATPTAPMMPKPPVCGHCGRGFESFFGTKRGVFCSENCAVAAEKEAKAADIVDAAKAAHNALFCSGPRCVERLKPTTIGRPELLYLGDDRQYRFCRTRCRAEFLIDRGIQKAFSGKSE